MLSKRVVLAAALTVLGLLAAGPVIRPALECSRSYPPGTPGSGSTRLTDATIEPSEHVTVEATLASPSFLAFLNSCDGSIPSIPDAPQQSVWIRNVAAGEAFADPEGLIARTHLASSSGGTLELKLRPHGVVDGRSYTLVPGALIATGITQAGKYEGTFSLGGGDDGPAMNVTVHAQDLFLWPLLVLIAGAYVGWLLIRRRDEARPRELLRAALRGAKDSHDRFREAHPACPYHLDSVFPSDKAWSPDRNGTPAQRLLAGIDDAKTEADLKDIAGQLADLVAMASLLPDLCDARAKLELAARAQEDTEPVVVTAYTGRAGDLETPSPLRAATTLLLREALPATSAATMSAFLRKLQNQEFATAGWVRAARYYPAVQERWTEAERIDPDLGTRATAPSATVHVAVWLATSLVDLDARSPFNELVKAHKEADAVLSRNDSRLVTLTAITSPPFEQLSIPDARSAEQIIADVERRDRLDFVLTFLITAAIYMLTHYLGKDFGGSPFEYLNAFLAGAGGSVIFNWKLLPWYRSYRTGVTA